MSLTMKTPTNTGKIKKQWKSARRKCRSHLYDKFFYENFFFDPMNMNVFVKPLGKIKCILKIRSIMPSSKNKDACRA